MHIIARNSSVLIFAIVVTALLGTMCYFTANRDPAPLLIADQTGTWEQISLSLSERLKGMFPVGTPQSDVAAELLREGFNKIEPSDTFPLGAVAGYRHSYELERSRFPCQNTWGVYFDTDTDDRITRIVGQLGGVCF